MKRKDIANFVSAALEEQMQMDLSNVGLDDDLGDTIGLDSLGKLELLVVVEDKFDMTFLEASTESASTINAMIDMTLAELARQNEAA